MWICEEVGTVVMVDFVKVDVTRNVITIQMLKPQINSVAVTILFNLPDDVNKSHSHTSTNEKITVNIL